jgi:hypothetical protein
MVERHIFAPAVRCLIPEYARQPDLVPGRGPLSHPRNITQTKDANGAGVASIGMNEHQQEKVSLNLDLLSATLAIVSAALPTGVLGYLLG